MSVQSQDLTGDVKAGIRALWWLFLLRGVFITVFGVLALVNGPAAVELLGLILGIYIVIDGVLTIVAAIAERKRIGSFGWYVVQGVLEIIIGILILTFPSAFAIGVGLIIIWAIIIVTIIAGIVGLRLSFAAKGVTKTWGWGVFANALTLLIGIALLVSVFMYTDKLLEILLVIIGIWALIVGIVTIVWSFIARKFMNEAFKSLSVTQTTITS